MKLQEEYLIKRTLTEEFLTHEGYVRFNGFPVAYIKSDLSVELLLPFSQLRRHPYYSATFNGFIELDSSLSLLCPKFTLAVIEEWGARFFNTPKNENRSKYIKAALGRLFGQHTGINNLVHSLIHPEIPEYPLSDMLSESEKEVFLGQRYKQSPVYITNGFWSNHLKNKSPVYQPTREARRLVPMDGSFMAVFTSNELFYEIKIDDEHRHNLLGICIRKVNSEGVIEKAWFLPRKLWKWFLFEPEEKHFLSESSLKKFLPQSSTSDDEDKSLDERLDQLAWTQDKTLTCQELEDVLVLLTEIESPQTPLQITDPILKQLLVDDRSLSAVIDETENLTNRRHTLYKVNPAGFALACAAKAAEFQGDSKPGGIQYCPMPDIDFLATINHLEN